MHAAPSAIPIYQDAIKLWNGAPGIKLSFRYEYDWGLLATSTSPIAHIFDSKSTQPQHQGQMTYTYVINPRLVNTFTGQSSWYTAIFGVLDFQATQAAIPVRLSIGDGGANGGGFTSLGVGIPTGRNVGQLQLIDDLSYIRGAHTLKVGVNYRYNKVTDTSLSSGSVAGSYSLKDIADFASGVVNGSNTGSTFTQSYPILAAAHIRVASLDFYATDEWAIARFTTITQVLLSGISNYDGLSVQLRHAFSYGFSGQLGYTWSHGLQLGGVYDPRNLNFGYSNSGLDNRHNFTADLLWMMPKLRNNLLDRVVGGWTLGAKAFAFSGRPFSVSNPSLGGQIYANFSGTILADMVDPSALGKKCGSGAVNPPCLTQSQFLYTSTSACNGATNGCLTAQSDFGNVPPNSFYGPGYFDIDTQVTKTVKIRERMNLQIGAGAYNTLNHPNFGQPSGSATSASIGKITGTVSAPVSIYGSGQGAIVSGRVLVLTGKFNF